MDVTPCCLLNSYTDPQRLLTSATCSSPFYGEGESFKSQPIFTSRSRGGLSTYRRQVRLSTLAGREINSTKDLKDEIRLWGKKEKLSVKKIRDLMTWIEAHGSVQLDGETYGLILERALSLKGQKADDIVSISMERLIDYVAFDLNGGGQPSKPVEYYFHAVMKFWINKARQTRTAQEWLARWWTYYEESPHRIPVPTPQSYAIIMSGWGKEGEPSQALALLNDMHTREQVKPEVYHYETTLTAYVESFLKRPNKQSERSSVGYDTENVLLQMTEWLEEFASGVRASASADVTGRPPQTIVLQNLNKVIRCWVDSREREAAIRATAILDLVDNVFFESDKSPADWVALAEAYYNAIRAWSYASTGRKKGIPDGLSELSQSDRDPMHRIQTLLFRLEGYVDDAKSADQIPLRKLRRIYGSAISSYASEFNRRSGKESSSKARELWERFKDRGYGTPDVTLYNHLFHVFGKFGDNQFSELLWQEMLNDGVAFPDLKTYNWRLLCYKNNNFSINNLAKAKRVWNEMREKGISPDSISYNTYLGCFVGTQELLIAREGDAVFHELLDMSRHGDWACQVSVVSLNTIIGIWSKLATTSKVVDDKEEALKAILVNLMEVNKLFSDGLCIVRPDTKTESGITSLLQAANVEKEKQLGVFRLLEKFSRR